MSSPLFTTIRKGSSKKDAHLFGKKNGTVAIDEFSDSSDDENVTLSCNAFTSKDDSREDKDGKGLYESRADSVASMAYEEAMNRVMDDSDSGSDLDVAASTNNKDSIVNQCTSPLSNLFAISVDTRKDFPTAYCIEQRNTHIQSPSLSQRNLKLLGLGVENDKERDISPIVCTDGFESGCNIHNGASNTNNSINVVHDSDSSSSSSDDDGMFVSVQENIDTRNMPNQRAKQIKEQESSYRSLTHHASSPQLRRLEHPTVKQLATPPSSDRSRSNSPLTRRPMISVDNTDRGNGKSQSSVNRRRSRGKKNIANSNTKHALSDDDRSMSGSESTYNYVKKLYASNAKLNTSGRSNLMWSATDRNNKNSWVIKTSGNNTSMSGSSKDDKRQVFTNLEECCLNDIPTSLLDTELKERLMRASSQDADFTVPNVHSTMPSKENNEQTTQRMTEIVIPLDKENKLVRLKSMIIDKLYSGDKRYFQSIKIAAHVKSFVEETMEDAAELLNERRCSRKKQNGGNGASIKIKIKKGGLPNLEPGNKKPEVRQEDKYLIDTVRVSDTCTMYDNHCQALIRVTATLQDIPPELMVMLREKARRSDAQSSVMKV